MEPGQDEVRQQLARIVASGGFANADRMSAFLRYVVERTLTGDEAQIKEYAIGVDVFERDASYDPRLDSIVRVEARRLRSKLDEFYANEGANDPIVIRIRRGSYVPVFEQRVTPEPAPAVAIRRDGHRRRTALAAVAVVLAALALGAAAWRYRSAEASPTMSVVVLPFAQYTTSERDRLLADRITDGVTSELARLGTLRVVSHTTARQLGDGTRRASEIGQALQVDVLIEGSLDRTGDRLEASVRLVSATTDRKLWVENFEGSVAEASDLERRIALAVAPAVLEHGRR